MLLYHIMKTIRYVKLLILFAKLFYGLLNLLYRMIIGAIINHQDLQLVNRIILIDTALNGTVNPLLLIKAGNDNRHTRGIILVNWNRLVEASE